MMEKPGRINYFLWGIIANGLNYDHDLETLRKIVILNIIIIHTRVWTSGDWFSAG
jgi:hypothetical protein